MRFIAFCIGTCVIAAIANGQSHAPPALVGPDALGRLLPTPGDVQQFRNDRYVGIFYFLWLNHRYVHDNIKILRDNPLARSTCASPPWGPPKAYHFWGEPLFGYYRSDDPWVLRRHATLLSDAGVDFLVFDTTNAVIYEPVVLRLCEVFEQLKRHGEHVPQFCFMVNTRAGRTAQRIFELLYKPGRFRDLWFHWKGKPLLICDPEQASDEVREFFTLRKAHWPFELINTHNAWHWEATYPQVYSYDTNSEQAEQVNVSVGQNLHQDTGRVEMMSTGHARGRSFHAGDVDDRPDAHLYGFNFEEQWQRAHELDPEVVFVTGWNEWVAMQLNTAGPPKFCDQFDLEFSRDVEMVRDGYGDNYYMQMAAHIRRFKGMRLPRLAPNKPEMSLDADFDQWDRVPNAYNDHALDTLPRDHPGCGELHYRVDSGRNDLRKLKVSHNDHYVFFYAKTADDISARTSDSWMWLLLDVPGISSPNWEEFDFLVNRQASGPSTVSLERSLGGWNWQSVGDVPCRVNHDEIQLAIPREILAGHETGPGNLVIDFKWIDNAQRPGDILDLYIHGDTAPDGRFRYRYEVKDSTETTP